MDRPDYEKLCRQAALDAGADLELDRAVADAMELLDQMLDAKDPYSWRIRLFHCLRRISMSRAAMAGQSHAYLELLAGTDLRGKARVPACLRAALERTAAAGHDGFRLSVLERPEWSGLAGLETHGVPDRDQR